MKRILLIAAMLAIAWTATAVAAAEFRRGQWPNTDFSRASVSPAEIMSGGVPKDGIPSIDDPKFKAVGAVSDLADTEPVVGVVLGGEAKAYPLRILIWHEIVNDVVGGVPVAVTFCPLCNTAVVFDRRLDGRLFDFGVTGMLRNSDMVMYDRQTESWWQQFMGNAIVGELTGAELKILPSRLESWANFKARAPDGLVQVPNSSFMRNYGRNPYAGYDSLSRPFLYNGETPDGIAPLARVVSLGDRSQAWSLDLLRRERKVSLADGTVIEWTPGQASALDSSSIAAGADVGNVLVRRRTGDDWEDIPYFVDFAFAFHAFQPEAPIHLP